MGWSSRLGSGIVFELKERGTEASRYYLSSKPAKYSKKERDRKGAKKLRGYTSQPGIYEHKLHVQRMQMGQQPTRIAFSIYHTPSVLPKAHTEIRAPNGASTSHTRMSHNIRLPSRRRCRLRSFRRNSASAVVEETAAAASELSSSSATRIDSGGRNVWRIM